MPFTKGHKLATGRPVGSKSRTTLLQQERRAMFEAEASEMWIQTIRKLRPEYIADQFMGKAAEKIEHSGAITTDNGLTAELVAEAKKLLKQKLTKPNGTTNTN